MHKEMLHNTWLTKNFTAPTYPADLTRNGQKVASGQELHARADHVREYRVPDGDPGDGGVRSRNPRARGATHDAAPASCGTAIVCRDANREGPLAGRDRHVAATARSVARGNQDEARKAAV